VQTLTACDPLTYATQTSSQCPGNGAQEPSPPSRPLEAAGCAEECLPVAGTLSVAYRIVATDCEVASLGDVPTVLESSDAYAEVVTCPPEQPTVDWASERIVAFRAGGYTNDIGGEWTASVIDAVGDGAQTIVVVQDAPAPCSGVATRRIDHTFLVALPRDGSAVSVEDCVPRVVYPPVACAAP
jgi:hypothetical protein